MEEFLEEAKQIWLDANTSAAMASMGPMPKEEKERIFEETAIKRIAEHLSKRK